MDNGRTYPATSRSPSPPPYSPITPESGVATLAGQVGMQAELPQLPPNIPISESTNPDVIALRSALSVLQLQRLRSIQDVQTLSRQKGLALADPEAFAKDLAEGHIRSTAPRDSLEIFDDASAVSEDERLSKAFKESDKETFGNIPAPQNIVRCPPVNWNKYHVIGSVLDQLHEQQRRQPASGEAQRDTYTAAPHFVAASYNPWRDNIAERLEKPGLESNH